MSETLQGPACSTAVWGSGICAVYCRSNYLLNTQLMQHNNTKHINHNIKAIEDYHVHN